MICDNEFDMKQLSYFLLSLGSVIIFGALLFHFAFTKETPPPTLDTSQTTDEPAVAATVFPLYDIARTLSGDDIQVTLLLPPAASPHTFEPSPATVNAMSQSDLIFTVGHGLDDWAVQQVKSDIIRVVDKGISLRMNIEEEHGEEAGHEEGHEDEHEHGPIDPHYWLSGENGKIIAQNIANELKNTYPEFATNIDSRLADYLIALQAAHETTHTIVNEVGNKRIVTLHDAWYYFADAYGLTIVATYTPSAGKDPLPQDLAHLQEVITEHGIQTFYAERQTSTATLQAFLDDNQLRVAALDELGGLEGTQSYIDLLLYNANVFAGQP